MIKQTVVIVGSGQAGFQTAASLRLEGFEGEIILFGDEPGLPYQRPPLSKTYFADADAQRLLFRNADFFQRNRIKLWDNARAARIHRDRKEVELEDGRTIAYDKLVLALGTKNRELPIPGTRLANVLQLRTLKDADLLRHAAKNASRAVMIGGGFIGLEVASVLRGEGLEVSIIELEPRVMARAVSKPISAHYEQLHAASGVEFHLEESVTSLTGNKKGEVEALTLSDGTRLNADLVVVCAGVVPDIAIAQEAGLAVENGIRVDAHLRTDDPDIFAIGDCASFVHAASNRLVRIESVQNALDQAKCVAKNIAGQKGAQPQAYDRVAWFWSDQAGTKLQIAGLTGPADQWHVCQSDSPEKLTVLAFKDSQFIGAETVNNASDHMTARKILSGRDKVSFKDFESSGFDLRRLAREKTRTG
ncbi:MAG TPA: pyridine nucleotide-disulfide oxidoreductase [Devosia sp.]|nr:pyridine nucleotide-disulfide oxidoreductase [Devosia sp.]